MYRSSSLIANHPLHIDGDNVMFSGYSCIDPKSCVCFIAQGKQFHNYGIADNSIIWASTQEDVHEGDLVVVKDASQPRVCLFTSNNASDSDDDQIPTTNQKERIIAKVLGSFNLYV